MGTEAVDLEEAPPGLVAFAAGTAAVIAAGVEAGRATGAEIPKTVGGMYIDVINGGMAKPKLGTPTQRKVYHATPAETWQWFVCMMRQVKT